MSASLDHWIFTACRLGQRGTSGYQTYTSTTGVTREEDEALAQFTGFAATIDGGDACRTFGIKRLQNRWAIFQARQGSRDDLGRSSYFAEAFLVSDEFVQTHPPYAFYQSSSFLDCLTAAHVMSAEVPPRGEPLPVETLRADGAFLHSGEGTLAPRAWLCLRAAGRAGAAADLAANVLEPEKALPPQPVLLGDAEEDVVAAFALLWEIAPRVRPQLSLCTLLVETNTTPFVVAGWPPEFGRPSTPYLSRFGTVMEWSGTERRPVRELVRAEFYEALGALLGQECKPGIEKDFPLMVGSKALARQPEKCAAELEAFAGRLAADDRYRPLVSHLMDRLVAMIEAADLSLISEPALARLAHELLEERLPKAVRDELELRKLVAAFGRVELDKTTLPAAMTLAQEDWERWLPAERRILQSLENAEAGAVGWVYLLILRLCMGKLSPAPSRLRKGFVQSWNINPAIADNFGYLLSQTTPAEVVRLTDFLSKAGAEWPAAVVDRLPLKKLEDWTREAPAEAAELLAVALGGQTPPQERRDLTELIGNLFADQANILPFTEKLRRYLPGVESQISAAQGVLLLRLMPNENGLQRLLDQRYVQLLTFAPSVVAPLGEPPSKYSGLVFAIAAARLEDAATKGEASFLQAVQTEGTRLAPGEAPFRNQVLVSLLGLASSMTERALEAVLALPGAREAIEGALREFHSTDVARAFFARESVQAVLSEEEKRTLRRGLGLPEPAPLAPVFAPLASTEFSSPPCPAALLATPAPETPVQTLEVTESEPPPKSAAEPAKVENEPAAVEPEVAAATPVERPVPAPAAQIPAPARTGDETEEGLASPSSPAPRRTLAAQSLSKPAGRPVAAPVRIVTPAYNLPATSGRSPGRGRGRSEFDPTPRENGTATISADAKAKHPRVANDTFRNGDDSPGHESERRDDVPPQLPPPRAGISPIVLIAACLLAAAFGAAVCIYFLRPNVPSALGGSGVSSKGSPTSAATAPPDFQTKTPLSPPALNTMPAPVLPSPIAAPRETAASPTAPANAAQPDVRAIKLQVANLDFAAAEKLLDSSASDSAAREAKSKLDGWRQLSKDAASEPDALAALQKWKKLADEISASGDSPIRAKLKAASDRAAQYLRDEIKNRAAASIRIAERKNELDRLKPTIEAFKRESGSAELDQELSSAHSVLTAREKLIDDKWKAQTEPALVNMMEKFEQALVGARDPDKKKRETAMKNGQEAVQQITALLTDADKHADDPRFKDVQARWEQRPQEVEPGAHDPEQPKKDGAAQAEMIREIAKLVLKNKDPKRAREQLSQLSSAARDPRLQKLAATMLDIEVAIGERSFVTAHRTEKALRELSAADENAVAGLRKNFQEWYHGKAGDFAPADGIYDTSGVFAEQPADPKELLRQVQEAIQKKRNDGRFKSLPDVKTDGQMDEDTQNAILQLQIFHGWKQTGKVDQNLLDWLLPGSRARVKTKPGTR